MKKLSLKRKAPAKKAAPTRITNETVAEHRERILAGGRRFKYPMQYARHRLVLTTIIIISAALIAVGLIGWWQFYKVQNTSTLFYRISKVIPVSAASVDGAVVRYSDYLMYYNGSAHWLQKSEQVNLHTKDGERQNNYIKRKSMDIVIGNAYAQKLANDLKITVPTERIDQVTDQNRNTLTGRISQETYDASALSTIGWTPDEYRRDIKSQLIVQDVSFAIDTAAKQKRDQAIERIDKGEADFDKLATALGGDSTTKPTVAVSGLVPLANDDGGLAKAAAALKVGEVSKVIRTTAGDGYYFVKQLEKTDTQISYTYIKIPLTEFTKRLAELKKDNKIHEYIKIDSSDGQ